MKKLFLIVAVASVGLLSSCKKEITCECVTRVAGLQTDSQQITVEGKNEDDACNDEDTESTDALGIVTDYDCSPM